jgi:hypothetical protein
MHPISNDVYKTNCILITCNSRERYYERLVKYHDAYFKLGFFFTKLLFSGDVS